MKLEKIPVSYKGNEFSDAPNFITVNLDESDLSSIKKAIKILRENKDLSSISINTSFDLFDGEEDEEVSEWRDDLNQFIVYANEVYLYAQSKHDSSDQIESVALCEYSEEFNNLLK